MSRKPTETKKKVLEAACELFAGKGYKNVTVQEICELAEANIASINYYFGCKAKLYVEVLRHVNRIVETEYLAEDKFDMEPDEAIESFIKARLMLILNDGPGGWHPKLVHFEMSNPTEGEGREYLLDWMQNKFKFMSYLTRNYLGEKATELQVDIVRNSFHSQCIHLNISRQHKRSFFAGDKDPNKETVISEMIKMIIGGLKSYREEILRGNK